MIQKTIVLHITTENNATIQQAMKWMEEILPFEMPPDTEPMVNREGFLITRICAFYNQMVSPEDH